LIYFCLACAIIAFLFCFLIALYELKKRNVEQKNRKVYIILFGLLAAGCIVLAVFVFTSMLGQEYPVEYQIAVLIWVATSLVALIIYRSWLRNPRGTLKAAAVIGVMIVVGAGIGMLVRSVDIGIRINELSSTDGEVRSNAAYKLGNKKAKRAVEPLIALLNDTDEDVRAAAASALGDIGGARGVEPLIGLLLDADGQVRRFAIYSLGQIGDERAVEPLIDYLVNHAGAGSTGGYLWSSSNDCEITAIALGKIGMPALEPLLDVMCNEDEDCQSAAAKAIGEEIGKPATDALIKIIDNEDGRYGKTARYYAAGALAGINAKRAKKRLDEALTEKDYPVVAGGAEYYIMQGEEDTETKLIIALNLYGNQDMLDLYLNCGNSLLEAAAKSWAKKNGYSVMTSVGSPSVVWGD